MRCLLSTYAHLALLRDADVYVYLVERYCCSARGLCSGAAFSGCSFFCLRLFRFAPATAYACGSACLFILL